MHNLLYLDTARLGQMSNEALAASIDFVRLANEQGCSLYFIQLLQDGFASWPGFLQRQYPGLSSWCGIDLLRQRLRKISQANHDSEVVLASRSASLMKIAAKLLAGPCRNVLTTDSCWPAYRDTLRNELNQAGNQLTEVSVRSLCLRRSLSANELVDFMVRQFVLKKCDGLFLPLVDNLGVKLPIKAIVSEIRKHAELRFVAIDAAQAIGQVPLELDSDYCDFLLAGTHKWLRAFYSMGLGFYGNPSSRDYISDSIGRWTATGIVDDPLIAFCNELSLQHPKRYGETVQVAPLLVSDSAIAGLISKKIESPSLRKRNLNVIGEAARISGWRLVMPVNEFQSRIVLVEPQKNVTECSIQESFAHNGVSATTYPSGMVRLSLPSMPLEACHRQQLIDAFSSSTGRGMHSSIKLQGRTLLPDGICAIDKLC